MKKMSNNQLEDIYLNIYKHRNPDYLLPFSTGECMVYYKHYHNSYIINYRIIYIAIPNHFKIYIYDDFISLYKENSYFKKFDFNIDLEEIFEMKNYKDVKIPVFIKKDNLIKIVDRICKLTVFM